MFQVPHWTSDKAREYPLWSLRAHFSLFPLLPPGSFSSFLWCGVPVSGVLSCPFCSAFSPPALTSQFAPVFVCNWLLFFAARRFVLGSTMPFLVLGPSASMVNSFVNYLCFSTTPVSCGLPLPRFVVSSLVLLVSRLFAVFWWSRLLWSRPGLLG